MLVNKFFRFAIDRINGRFITGWCFRRIMKAKPVTIRVVADRHELGIVSCTNYRKDLKEKKLHPTGCCGFDFSFPADFEPDRYSAIHLYFDGHKEPSVTVSCRELLMLRPSPRRPIFFMHIPKAAGTSFNSFVRNCFAKDDFIPHIERLTPEQRQVLLQKHTPYLSGHIPWYEIVRLLEPWQFDLYSIAREPLSHLHSHLNYVRSIHTHAGHYGHEEYHHNDLIRGLGEKLAGTDFFDDGAAERFVAKLSGFERDFFDNIQTRYFLDYRPEQVTDADYRKAAQTIKHFRLIGLTERYDQFRDQFCKDLGLQSQLQTLRVNRAENYSLFDPGRSSTRRIVDPLIRFDCQLYELIASQWR